MLDDMVWYRSTKIALYGPSGGTGIFFRQVLMLFECSGTELCAAQWSDRCALRIGLNGSQRSGLIGVGCAVD